MTPTNPAQPAATSESVTEGHPDKLADRISDAIVDAHLAQDPFSRVAIETLLKGDLVVLAGEITANADVDMAAVAKRVLVDSGYDHPDTGLDASVCSVRLAVTRQSPEIATGVLPDAAAGADQGAGDQGVMIGYATDETPNRLPLQLHLAHRLAERLADVRRRSEVPWLRPDGKTQVTISQGANGSPPRLDTVVISTQHSEDIELNDLRAGLTELVLEPVLATHWPEALDHQPRLHLNPAGRWHLGGPAADAGLTGRKLAVDTYGAACPHGGGAFSGKDPSKTDRSGAYMARLLARTVVDRQWAHRCQVQIAYAISVAEPVSVSVDTHRTSLDMADDQITDSLCSEFDLRPAAIIEFLDLLRPIYEPTATYGHFGRDGLPWEITTR